MLTKSDYLRYLQCQKYLWLHKNRKELEPEVSETKQAIFDQGYEVESYAQKLFPNGIEVKEFFNKGHIETQKYIKEGHKVIFQANAMPKDLYTKADILKFNDQTKKWDIYEVKSSTEVKEEHIPDIAFQKIAFESDGIPIGGTYLIHINKEYIRKGKVDAKKLLTIEDLTEQAENWRNIIETDIPKVLKLIKLEKEVEKQIGKQCTKPYECPFKEYCWAYLPEFHIYNIQRLTEKQLTELQKLKIVKMIDVPNDFNLNEKQQNQLVATKTGENIIDKEAIQDKLNKLEYPLYFLDYETFAPAIPLFDGLKPYQQMPFQYSLHVIKNEGDEPEHYEYLHTGKDIPIPTLIEDMKKNIGTVGSVIVWHKSFEIGRNEEMAELYPKYANFLNSVNERVFDLMDIFKDQYYVDAKFKGSCSIKKVLPILVPSLSYSELEDVQEGGIASLYWFKHIYNDSEIKDRIEKNMLKYCELDTLAMVKIFNKIKKNKTPTL